MKKGSAFLLSIIADGQFHSGETLASQLGISRAAIWKSIKQLQSLGLDIEAVRGKGYRLPHAIELLSEKKIATLLSSQSKNICQSIHVLFKTDSTNSYLFNRLASNSQIHGHVVLAEYQAHGRGRRGNSWVSPLASGLMCSIGWRFEVSPKELSLLSLYMGVAAARALKDIDIKNTGLKWPNDIVVKDKKIGGILIEVRGEASGPVDVVIGIGVNYELAETHKAKIDKSVTDICSHTQRRLSRNKIAASLLSKIFEVLEDLNAGQCLHLLDEWRKLDCYVEQPARLLLPNEEIEGILKGVDNQGSLLMSVAGEMRSYTSGEVSLRVTTS